MMVQSRAGAHGTHFVAVRLGNVLGSRGSVVPIFKRQIERGGPVCVTHPEMTRYFMTVPESVLLVLQASAYGENGDLFVLDMGKPVRIVDLAEDLIRLSGREPHAEIPIIFTGVRPGEKLHEELIGEHEETSPTRDKQLLRIRGNHLDTSALEDAIRDLATLAVRGDAELIVAKLQEVVPEYQPPAIARAAPLVPPMTLTEVSQVPALRDPRTE
jgi:FlaA1/EpsC-like NDP-sugar epimerase